MQRHIRGILVAVVACIAVFGVVMGIWKYIHQYRVEEYEYQGTVVIIGWQDAYTRSWIFMNPNNFNEYKVVAIPERFVSNPVLTEKGETVFLEKFDDALYLTTVFEDGEFTRIPTSLSAEGERMIPLYGTKDGYVFSRVGRMDDDKQPIFLVHKNGTLDILANEQSRSSRLFVWGDCVVWANEKYDIQFDSGKILPVEGTFQGSLVSGESFLVHDCEKGSRVINGSGEVIETFGSQPYEVSGSGKDGAILTMQAQGSGGYTPLFDAEWSVKEWIRSSRRTYRRAFLYNAQIDDVRELPRNMGDWVIGNLCNSYQDRRFEQDRVKKIQFAMTKFLSHQ